MPVPKFVFISHPVTGDVEGNLKKIDAICKELHTTEVFPIFPSFGMRRYLTPDPNDRAIAKATIKAHLSVGYISEMYVYGQELTDHRKWEIEVAKENHIRVIGMTQEMQLALAELFFDGAL